MANDVIVVIGSGGIGVAIARRQGFGKTVLLADFEEKTLQSAANDMKAAIPGSHLPLIIAGEAKGGSGGYGWVSGPNDLLANELNVKAINQRDPAYALTRAAYMAKDGGTSAASVARREAGREIRRAFNQGNFMYLAVRGEIDGTTLSVEGEVFECR
jgi:hypothetical protein